MEMCRPCFCESVVWLLRWPGCKPGWDQSAECPSPADVGGMYEVGRN